MADGELPMIPKARGLDVSDYQPPAEMEYALWSQEGFCYLYYQVARGTELTPYAKEHRRKARAAGWLTAPYIELYPADPEGQARLLISQREPDDELPSMVAFEYARGEAVLRVFCNVFDAVGWGGLTIYCNYPIWIEQIAEAQRARYVSYPLLFAGYPYDTPAGKPVPMDATSVALRSHPPLVAQAHVPPPWSGYWAWQHSGQASLYPYKRFLDMQVHSMTEAQLRATYSSNSLSPTLPGTLLGVHTEITSQALPIARKFRAAGAKLRGMCSVEDPGKLVDFYDENPDGIRVWRCKNPNNNWEGGQFVVGASTQEIEDFCAASMRLIRTHLNPTEYRRATWKLPGYNEWCPNDPDQSGAPPGRRKPYPAGWKKLAEIFMRLLDYCEKDSPYWVNQGLDPIRLALPGLCAGTPEWTEILAMKETGLFGRMKQRGDLWWVHEGVSWWDKPIDEGYGITIPDAPYVPNSGTMCMRVSYTTYAVGDDMPDFGVGEWADGANRNTPYPERLERAIWYDAKLRQNKYARCFCVYEVTDDPHSTWYPQDFTGMMLDLSTINYAVREAQVPNPLPLEEEEDQMPITQVQIDSLRSGVTSVQEDAEVLLATATNLQTALDSLVAAATGLQNGVRGLRDNLLEQQAAAEELLGEVDSLVADSDLPWWQKFSSYPAKGAIAAPMKSMTWRNADGSVIVPSPRTKVIDYPMDLWGINVTLKLLLVTDPAGPYKWWLAAGDVSPA